MTAPSEPGPLTFFIPGTPVPQGSKRQTRDGHMFEANPNLRLWRSTITAYAREAKGAGRGWPVTGPVAVTADFHFRRPKTHYRTGRYAGEVKPNAPRYMSNTPDLDKLMRALGDGLVDAGVIRDDALIVTQHITKMYHEEPGILVILSPVSNPIVREVK